MEATIYFQPSSQCLHSLVLLTLHTCLKEPTFTVVRLMLFFITIIASSSISSSFLLHLFIHNEKKTFATIIVDSNLSFMGLLPCLQIHHTLYLPFANVSFLCFPLRVDHHRHTIVVKLLAFLSSA
jgi:hypothetical protein